MHAPVAGRRKGVTSAAQSNAPGSPPANVFGDASGGPSWLDMDASDPAPTGQASANVHPSFTVTNSLPPSRHASPPTGRRQDSSHALSFLDSGSDLLGGTRRSSPPKALVLGTQSAASRSDAPTFLFDDADDGAGVWQHKVPAAAASAPALAPQSSHMSPGLVDQWRQLRAALKTLESDLKESSESVQAFAEERHPLCAEVAGLRAQLQALRLKQSEAASAKAHPAGVQAAEPSGTSSSEQQRQREEETAAYRQQVADAYRVSLAEAEAAAAAQDAQLAEANARWERTREAAGSATADDPTHAAALDRLQSSLSTMLAATKRGFMLHVKPILSRSIAAEMSAAAKQRTDIFHQDRLELDGVLEQHRRSGAAARQTFRDVHTGDLRQKRDAAFGSIRQELLAEASRAAQESERRLAAYCVHVSEAAQQIRLSTEETVKQLAAAAERNFADAAALRALELQQSRERKAAQLAVHRQRASAEKKNLAAAGTRRASDADVRPGVVCAATEKGLASFQRQLHAALQDCLLRLDQMRLLSNAEGNALQSRMGARSPAAPTPQSSRRAREEMEARAAASAKSLAVQLSQFQADVESAKETVRGIGKTLQVKRVRLVVLHASCEATRQAWEADTRRDLQSALTESSRGNRPVVTKDAILAETLESLHAKLAALMGRSRELQGARYEWYNQLQDKFTRLSRQRRPADEALHRVFALYEKLHAKAASFEGIQRATQVAEADAMAARSQVQGERSELLSRQEHLGSVADRLQKDSHHLTRADRRVKKLIAKQQTEQYRLAALLASAPPPSSLPPRQRQPPLINPPGPLEDVGMNGQSAKAGGRKGGAIGALRPAAPSPEVAPQRDVGRSPGGHATPKWPGSLHSSYRTNSEFSTELVLLDDESVDEIAALQAALGLASCSAMPANDTYMGRSLTTPSVSR